MNQTFDQAFEALRNKWKGKFLGAEQVDIM
jgi:hypothetical protein